MREYTETTPANLQEFSTSRILKESWEICTKYFGALVMPVTVITLPCLAVAFLVNGQAGESLTRFLNAVLGPIATMGVHRAILKLKSEGVTPTFSRTFNEGNDYWWRGFKINFVTGLVSIPAISIMVALLFPGLMAWGKTKTPQAGLLLWAGLIACFALIMWFCARACLVFPAMADNRNSAWNAFTEGWSMTKGRTWTVVRLCLAMTGIALALALGFLLIGAIAVATEACTEDTAVALLAIPALMTFMFSLALVNTATNLAYQALKPAPAEEQVPVTTV